MSYQPKHMSSAPPVFSRHGYNELSKALQNVRIAATEAYEKEEYGIEFLCRETIVNLKTLANELGVIMELE